jgi:plasmid stabilization system protein ParE
VPPLTPAERNASEAYRDHIVQLSQPARAAAYVDSWRVALDSTRDATWGDDDRCSNTSGRT